MNTIGSQQEAQFPAMREMFALVGIGIDEPVTVAVEAAVANEDGCSADQVPVDGLVWWMWEDRDEIWRNGTPIYSSSGTCLFNTVYVLVDGKVRHMTIDNACEHIGDYNADVKPSCDRCPDHGHQITKADVNCWRWVIS